jgi:hypothetical protein
VKEMACRLKTLKNFKIRGISDASQNIWQWQQSIGPFTSRST